MDTIEQADSNKVFEALEKVHDRKSFMAFVRALVEEREQAEKLEREKSEYYKYGAALGWQNSEISSYLSAALSCIEDWDSLGKPVLEEPAWRGFAEFLYLGKIYE